MKIIDYYDEIYEPVTFPFKWHVSLGHKTCNGKRVWRFDLIGLLFDRYNGFFRSGGWDMHMYPSYGTGFRDLWNNLCTYLTPWYHPRRCLLSNLFNRNESKLLSCTRKSCEFRNRDADMRYFHVRFGFLFGTMWVSRYVSDSGKGENLFVRGIFSIMSEDNEVRQLREERQIIVRRMPILTLRQCERFLNAAVNGTKDWLSWV